MSNSIKHIPGLDLLRAIAVMLVLVHHWIPKDFVFNILNNGLMGVTLFFVLSGYLISKILFIQKSDDKQGIVSKLRTFYIRRSLRIFPVYYLVILILWLLKDSLADYNIPAYGFYLQNFWFVSIDGFEWPNAHLWSLAVEEQYYLIWPLLVLLTPFKHLKTLIVAFIAVGPATRYFGYEYLQMQGHSPDMVHVLTPTAFDCFGLGSLLALIEHNRPDWLSNNLSTQRTWGLMLISFSLFVIGSFSAFSDVLNRFSFSIFSLFLIALLIRPHGNRFATILATPPLKGLLYFGKISYGIYLFHPYVSLAYERVVPSLLVGAPRDSLLLPKVNFILLLILTIAVSSLSWEFLEKPINRLKNRFTY